MQSTGTARRGVRADGAPQSIFITDLNLRTLFCNLEPDVAQTWKKVSRLKLLMWDKGTKLTACIPDQDFDDTAQWGTI